MNAFPKSNSMRNVAAWSLALALGVTSAAALAGKMDVKLSGDQEVPPVKSAGSAAGSITIGDDGSVSGSVTATGFTPTAAHIPKLSMRHTRLVISTPPKNAPSNLPSTI